MAEVNAKSVKNLPRELKEALGSTDIALAVQEIGRKMKLHVDQVGELSGLVDLTIIGAVNPKNFAEEAEDRLALSREEAVKLTEEVNNKIFLPVRGALMKIYQEEKRGPSEKLETPEEIIAAISNPEKLGRISGGVRPGMTKEVIDREVVPPATPAAPALSDPAPDVASYPRPQVGTEVTPGAPPAKATVVPIKAETDLPKIHQEKFEDVVRIPKKETTVAPEVSRHPSIPEDVKQKINNDPYKEPI